MKVDIGQDDLDLKLKITLLNPLPVTSFFQYPLKISEKLILILKLILSGGVDKDQSNKMGKSEELDAEFSLVEGEQAYAKDIKMTQFHQFVAVLLLL